MPDRDCPRCESTLVAPNPAAPGLQACRGCRGRWLEATELGAAVGDSAALCRLIADRGRATALRCPACPGETLVLVRIAGCGLDACPAWSGVFFDRGELEAVRARRPGAGSRGADVTNPGRLAAGDVVLQAIAGLVELAGDLLS